MNIIIRNLTVDVLNQNKDLLKIAVRNKSKFEGWLKFELARRLEQFGFNEVRVESKFEKSKGRADIVFKKDHLLYGVELKTSNTNWRIEGVSGASRPITKNISSIIQDVKKLDSSNGIIAFVLFPIPINDIRWKEYIKQINSKTGLKIDPILDCEMVKINHFQNGHCFLLVCTAKAKEL